MADMEMRPNSYLLQICRRYFVTDILQIFHRTNMYICSISFSLVRVVGSTNCFTRPLCFLRGMFKVMYYSFSFCRRLSVGSTNCFTRPFVFFYEECLRLCISRLFLPAFISRFDKLFYPAFRVFRTTNVYVLLVLLPAFIGGFD